jgi:chromosome segregation ATPase
MPLHPFPSLTPPAASRRVRAAEEQRAGHTIGPPQVDTHNREDRIEEAGPNAKEPAHTPPCLSTGDTPDPQASKRPRQRQQAIPIDGGPISDPAGDAILPFTSTLDRCTPSRGQAHRAAVDSGTSSLCARLQTENTELRNKVETLEREKSELESSMDELQDDLTALADMSEEKSKSTEILLQDFRDIAEKFDVAEDRIAELELMVREQDHAAEITLSAVQVTMRGLERDIEAKQSQLVSLKHQAMDAACRVADILQETLHDIDVEQQYAITTTSTDIREMSHYLQYILFSMSRISAKIKSDSREPTKTIQQLHTRLFEFSKTASANSKSPALGSATLEAETSEGPQVAVAHSEDFIFSVENESNLSTRPAACDQLLNELNSGAQGRREPEDAAQSKEHDQNSSQCYIARPLSISCSDSKSQTDISSRVSESVEAQLSSSCPAILARTENAVALDNSQAYVVQCAAEKGGDPHSAQSKIARVKEVSTTIVAELEKLRSTHEEIERIQEELRRVQDRVAIADAALAEKDSTIATLKVEVQRLLNERDHLRTDTLDRKSEAERERIKVVSIQAEIEEQLNMTAAAVADLGIKEAELSRAHKEIRECNDRTAALESIQIENEQLQTIAAQYNAMQNEAVLSAEKIEACRAELKVVQEKLHISEAILSTRDATIADLKIELSNSARKQEESSSTIAEKGQMAKNVQEKLTTAEAEINRLEEIAKSTNVQLELQGRDLSSAKDLIRELMDRCASLDSSQESHAANSRTAVSAEMERTMCEALDKYETVLDKLSRLRKRAKRLEILLGAERKKNLDLVNENQIRHSGLQLSPKSDRISSVRDRAGQSVQRLPLSPFHVTNVG